MFGGSRNGPLLAGFELLMRVRWSWIWRVRWSGPAAASSPNGRWPGRQRSPTPA